MYADSFTVYIKIDDIYKHIADDVASRFDTSNYELDNPLPKRKKKKVIGSIKDGLARIFITKFFGLRAQTYSYLLGDDIKAKGKQKRFIKRKLRFENPKSCLQATQLENKINHLDKTEIGIDNFFVTKEKKQSNHLKLKEKCFY